MKDIPQSYMAIPSFVDPLSEQTEGDNREYIEKFCRFIIGLCSQHLFISHEKLLSYCFKDVKNKSRKGSQESLDIVHIVIYVVCRKLYPLLNYKKIGKIFGRDHATIYYIVNKVEEKMSIYGVWRKNVNTILFHAGMEQRHFNKTI